MVGGLFPEAFANTVRNRGCLILRGVVSEDEAINFEASLEDYVQRHPVVGGHPSKKPAAWNVFWTQPQVQFRSHPAVMESMRAVSYHWYTSTPIDFAGQVVYPDRIRIRYPSDDPEKFPLSPHLDSGAIERWEDDINRKKLCGYFRRQVGRLGRVGSAVSCELQN
jgi:hypothetical protein